MHAGCACAENHGVPQRLLLDNDLSIAALSANKYMTATGVLACGVHFLMSCWQSGRLAGHLIG
jgi:hypothetical protein